MAAEMKASVLLTLKDELTGKAKAAAKGLAELAGAASKLKGTDALGKTAADAGKLAGAADKAASAMSRVAGTHIGDGGFSAATRSANAYAEAVTRAAGAAQKAAIASGKAATAAYDARVAARPTGADIYYHGAKAEAAAKSRTPMMAVTGNETQRATAIASNLDRANPGMYAGRKGGELLEKHVAEELERQKASNGGGVVGVGNKAMNAWFGVQVGAMAAHAVDHTISRAGDVDAMREKLRLASGGDKTAADAAYAKAMELSGKYKNTTVLENLHIIDDLRANLPENLDHILKDSTDPFVKMHSFFKAWEGGKHTGKADAALKEVGAAIRAGELTANITGEQLAGYVQTIATARVVMGDKFKVHDYLTMVRQASIDLAGAGKTFQMIDAPVLAQAMGAPRAGTALQSIGQRLVAGNRIQNQVAEGWRALGLVDESVLGKGDFNKKGEIVGSHLKGKKWLRDADMLANRPTDFVMTRLAPALEKAGFTALKGAEMAKAWETKDADKLVHLMAEFTKGAGNLAELRRRIGPLASDPVLAKALETLFERAPSIVRDEQRIGAVPKNLEDFDSYDAAKQRLAAQADRLFQASTGDGFMKTVNKAINGLAGMMGSAADAVDAWMHPKHEMSTEWMAWEANGLLWNQRARAALPAWAGGYGNMVAPDAATAKDIAAFADLANLPGVDWRTKAETDGKARAAAAGGRYQLGGSELAEAEAAERAGVFNEAAGAAAEATAKLREFAAGPAVPTMLGGPMADNAQAGAPEGVSIIAEGPAVTFNQAPPSISVNTTINVTTNAAPAEIGSAVAGHVSSAVRGALHDGGN